MCSEMAHRQPAITAQGLGKCFHVYRRPAHRLLQAFAGGRRRFYEEFWALRDVDLQLIARTLTPSTGTIEVHGRVAALLELGSGFNPEFTGRENVVLNATILGLEGGEIGRRMQPILDFADIGDFIDQPVKTYSSGMVMRLAFAVMAHVDADILVIDEALAVGDAFFNQKCMRYLKDFKERGTLLFVSHDSAAVRALCDRAIWLEGGILRAEGDARDVVDQYLEAFIAEREGREVDKAHAKSGVGRAIARDFREPLMDRSLLRNDIVVPAFDPSSEGFGERSAELLDVALVDEEGRQMAIIRGGETVALEIVARAGRDLVSPIIGFYLRDRMGQELFGDNTYLATMDDPVSCAAGDTFRARFVFDMPRLAVGDYHFTVGIATGTQEEHVVQHWVHEALQLRSQGQGMPRGLMGVPMRDVSLECV